MTPEIEEFVESSIEENSQITLVEIKRKTNEKFSVNVCIETIRRVIYKLKITLKKATRTLENVNSEISKIKRKEYARNFLNEDSESDQIKIFIDESGFNLHLRRTMARSARGAPASIIIPAVRGRNVSLISAISRDDVIFSDAIIGPVDSERYKIFFQGLINKCIEKNILSNCVFVMDNARIHNSLIMRNFYEENELIVKFLSPYSYMLNPIVFGFSKIKACVRRKLAGNGGF